MLLDRGDWLGIFLLIPWIALWKWLPRAALMIGAKMYVEEEVFGKGEKKAGAGQ